MASKRNYLTLKQKIEIVEVYNKEKLSVRDLSKRFNIGKTQAAHIIKNKNDLLSKWHSNININEKRSFLKTGGKDVDQMCYDWFVKARSKRIPLSGPLMQSKAKEIAESIGHGGFSASSGWLDKFRKRHNISFKSISGEAASVNQEDVTAFLSKQPLILKDYLPRDVYNADETGLFFRALPDKTLNLKHEKCIGGKLAKERLTILHCVNMAGHKEKLLVIGKAAKPRAFKNINVNDLPVTWRSNSKAWMTGSIMTEWLKQLDNKMGMQKRNILLFVDNACSHPRDIQLKNIKLTFLPPNCTSVCQPLDQGVIKNFKVHYRTSIVNAILSKIDSSNSAHELAKSINLLDVVYFIKHAWDKVSEETIKNCFRKAGIVSEFQRTMSSEDEFTTEDDIPLSLLAELWNKSPGSNVQAFFDFDNDLVTDDTDESLAVTNQPSDVAELEETSDEDSEVASSKQIKSYQQAIDLVKQLKEFSQDRGDAAGLELLTNLELSYHGRNIKKSTRQTTLLNYFEPS